MKKSLLASAIVGLAFLSSSAFGAAIVTVNVSIAKQLFDQNNVALNGGVLGVNGDGAVIQLGYFSTATTGNLFSGVWVPLTGKGGLNTAFNTTSVGDGLSSGANNRAAFNVTFDLSDPTKNQGLPLLNQPLGVRIYNGLTLASSSFFETVASPDWLLPTPVESPGPTPLSVSFANANSRLQSSSSALAATVQTAIPVVGAPEPTSAALLMVGLVSLASRRRRTAKA